MILSRELVQAVTGDADRWHGPLEAALRRWQITTPTRVAMFLSQCGHESGGYRLVVESLRYSADAILRTWPNRFSADDAKAMAHDEQRIAERAYGGRMGNGPEGSGDGYRYRGRGIIQLTGRDSYQRCGEALGLDLAGMPDLLEQPSAAAQSAGWFWATRGCNELADADDFIGTTRKINGGTNGQASRDTWLVTVRAAIDRYPLGEQRTETPQQAGPTGTQPFEREDRRMSALALFAPVLAQLIPQIATVLNPQSEVARRNVAIAQTISDTIVKAAGAANIQDAVEKMQDPVTGPALTKEVQKAVVTEPRIMAALQVVEVGGGPAAAAERDHVATQAERPFWYSAVFWISLVMLPLVYWLVGSLIVGGTVLPAEAPWWAKTMIALFGGEWTGEARSGGFNLVIGLVLGGICGVYYGISVTQRNTDKTQPGATP